MLSLAIVISVAVMLISVSFPLAATNTASAAIALTVGLASLLASRHTLRQTTLASAWWWSVTALIGWCTVEFASGLSLASSSSIASLRFTVVTLGFCPIVALLGAKRPQHVAWNFVVLSLWAITALPAVENLLLRGSALRSVSEARAWFLWILIMLGPINFLPTRFWLPSLLLATGQASALSSMLPLVRGIAGQPQTAIGLLLAAAAAATAWLLSRRASRAANRYDRLWLDFRDSFGLLWGLRVQERVNAVARQNGWDLELTWRGFRRRASDESLSDIDPPIEPALRTSIKGLLRRFVTAAWIEERLGGEA